jgi:hypothetical protein
VRRTLNTLVIVQGGWIGPAEESESKSYIATEGRDYEADEMR